VTLPRLLQEPQKYEDIDYKIPPTLPLPKGGIVPLFGKEGRGEIFFVEAL